MHSVKWWEGLWDEDIDKASNVLDIIESLGVKIIALDLDETLLDYILFPSTDSSLQEIAKHIRPCFKILISTALKRGHPDIAIVTWNIVGTLVSKVLKVALPNSDTSKIIVEDNPRRFEIYPISPRRFFLGKRLHLERVVQKYQIINHRHLQPREVLLFDDSIFNFFVAVRSGHLAYRVKNNVSLDGILKWLRKEEHKRLKIKETDDGS